MSLGVCMCTCGPPENGRCMACGALGPRTYPVPMAPVVQPQVGVVKIVEPGPSLDDIRKIIREEIQRAKGRDEA